MLNLADIVVDPELESLLPPLSDEEYTGLIGSVMRDGFTDPLIVWLNHGTLVDGHNRLRIWKDAGSDEDRAPEVYEMPFADKDAVKEWMLRRQLARRNLTDAGRIKVTLILKPYLEKRGKANLSAGGKNKAGKEPLPKLAKVADPVDTRRELAELAGVSPETFRKAESVLDTAPEEIKAAMLAPKTDASHISIDKAFKETKAATAQKPEQQQKWSQGSASLPKPPEHAPEDSESDNLFHLKRYWKMASKKDRTAFLKWTKAQ